MRRLCSGAGHWSAQYFKGWFVVLVFLLFSAAEAEVVRIDVHSRSDIAGGRTYGLAGPYERLLGRVYFEVDPRNTINESIIDIQYAPLNGLGRVEFSSDFYLIKPKDVEAGNGTVLVDVMNRGRKRVLHYFNFASAQLEPESQVDMGDGFLLDQGFSLLYVGWQFDVPLQRGLMRAYPPVATEKGAPIYGLVRSDFVVRESAHHHSLGDRGHIPYVVVDADDPPVSRHVHLDFAVVEREAMCELAQVDACRAGRRVGNDRPEFEVVEIVGCQAQEVRSGREIRERNVERGAVPLNPRGADDDVGIRVSAPQHLDDVANGGTVERRHDADLAGKRRQRTLAARVEQALGREALFELVEGQLQRSKPLRLEMLADDLILAFRVVHADATARHDAEPVARREAQGAHGRPEHDPLELRAGVLQREVHVAGIPDAAVR